MMYETTDMVASLDKPCQNSLFFVVLITFSLMGIFFQNFAYEFPETLPLYCKQYYFDTGRVEQATMRAITQY